MRAVILAGGLITGLEEQEKAFLMIEDRPMFEYVLQALAGVEAIDEQIIVGPSNIESWVKQQGNKRLRVIHARERLMENVLLGVEQAEHEDELILLTTCDIPFLTTEAVNDFLERCEMDASVDFYYPIIRKEDTERVFPGMKRTYVRLREGVFTGGNLFLVRPAVIKRMAERVEEILRNRKSPLKISSELGWSFTCRLLLSQVYGFLRLAQLEQRFSELFGIRAKAIISPYPQIGTDVDKQSDLLLAREIMSQSLASNTKEMV
jgi:molybdopterin-guanine dinucleotide biosynthesis protein A